jgi:three-Cys-motif partner protein
MRYFDMFAKGMHKKAGIRYVELCCGPGRCSTRDGKEQDGTALAIANHPSFVYVNDALFVDYNAEAVDALNARLQTQGATPRARAVLGDYNDPDSIRRALKERPFKGLTLCLVDPTSCDIPFQTIEMLAAEAGWKVDFIISFFLKSDFHRNGVQAALNRCYDSRKKYCDFLGCETFFDRSDVLRSAQNGNHKNVSDSFLHAYKDSLSRIGKSAQDMVLIGDLYYLLFATEHPRGLHFWREAKAKDPYGQTDLPGLEVS